MGRDPPAQAPRHRPRCGRITSTHLTGFDLTWNGQTVVGGEAPSPANSASHLPGDNLPVKPPLTALFIEPCDDVPGNERRQDDFSRT
jgi:hypothetical protein